MHTNVQDAKTPVCEDQPATPGVKVLVVVEGINDVEFLRRISRIVHIEDVSLPDLAAMEAAGRLITTATDPLEKAPSRRGQFQFTRHFENKESVRAVHKTREAAEEGFRHLRDLVKRRVREDQVEGGLRRRYPRHHVSRDDGRDARAEAGAARHRGEVVSQRGNGSAIAPIHSTRPAANAGVSASSMSARYSSSRLATAPTDSRGLNRRR